VEPEAIPASHNLEEPPMKQYTTTSPAPRRIRRLPLSRPLGLAAGVAAGVAAAAIVGPAASAVSGGWTTDHFEWGEVNEDTCDVPGLTVQDEGSGDSRYRTLLRGPDNLPYYEEHAIDTDVYTNLATGESVSLVEQRTFYAEHVTDNGDGTLTIVFISSGTHVMYDGAGAVIDRAAGSASIETVWDHAGTPSDPDHDQFLSHRFLRDSGNQLDFCGSLVGAIG
jgi:hypothetical protein